MKRILISMCLLAPAPLIADDDGKAPDAAKLVREVRYSEAEQS